MASPAAHALWLEGKALFKANQLSEATDKFAQALQAVVGDDTEAEPSADAAPYAHDAMLVQSKVNPLHNLTIDFMYRIDQVFSRVWVVSTCLCTIAK